MSLQTCKTWNIAMHWSHVCGFSSKWLSWWSFRWCVRVAEYTHYVHLYDFSLLCFLMWVLRCDGWWNDLKQWSHLCRFSPLCANRWILRISALVAEWSHIVHLFLFSSVWVNMKWRFIKLAWPNVLLHCCHTCGFSKEWVRKCILKDIIDKMIYCILNGNMCLALSVFWSVIISHFR